MQFIFADNKSKYDIIYTDADKERALKLYDDILAFPLLPGKFDVYGFVSFGDGNGRGIFFKSAKDDAVSDIDVYYVHGVDCEITSKYFESEYLKNMFFKFADQTVIDAIRDGSDSLNMDASYSTELVSLSDDTVAVEHEILKDIIAKLYQRKKVVIAIDDDQFVSENVLLLIKKIYGHLTPSLRKATTYLTGMCATDAFANVTSINIVPTSMLGEDTAGFIDLQNRSFKCKELQPYAELAEYLISCEPRNKEAVFEGYEDLCRCLKSAYENYKFMEYFEMIRSGSIEACDELMDSYVMDDAYDCNAPVPQMFSAALTELYENPEFYEKKFNFDIFYLRSFEEFYDLHYCTIEKMFLLSPDSLSYVDRKIFAKVSNVAVSLSTEDSVKKELELYNEQRNKTDGKSRSYSLIAEFIDKSVEIINDRLKMFNDRKDVIISRVHNDINKNVIAESIMENTALCCEYYKKQFSQLVTDASVYRVMLDEVICSVVENELNLYNKAKEEEHANELREKEERKNLEEIQKVFLKHGELSELMKSSEMEKFKVALKAVDSYPEKYSDIFASFYADYVVLMCRKNGVAKFFSKNNITVLSAVNEKSNPYMYECIREKLLITNPDIAVLFISKYAATLAGAVKQIVFAVLSNSNAIDSINSDIFKECCEFLEVLLRNRMIKGENVAFDQMDADYSKIEHKIEQLDSDSNSMMILAELNSYVPFKVNYSKGINKGIIAVIIIAVIALIVAVSCAVYALSQNNSDSEYDDTESGYSEIIDESADGGEQAE